MYKVLFVDLENHSIHDSLDNLKFYSEYLVVMCVHRGNEHLFKKVEYLEAYLENLKYEIIDVEGKQIVDFYIYTKAVELKLLSKAKCWIAVLSCDEGFSTFSRVSKSIDKVYKNLPVPNLKFDQILDKDVRQINMFTNQIIN